MQTKHRRFLSYFWPWLVAALWLATLNTHGHSFASFQSWQDRCQPQNTSGSLPSSALSDCLAMCGLPAATGAQCPTTPRALWVLLRQKELAGLLILKSSMVHKASARGPPNQYMLASKHQNTL